MASDRDLRPLQSRGPPKRLGHWEQVVSRQIGRVYYYNRVTEISTWLKPAEWEAYDRLVEMQAARALQSEDETRGTDNNARS